MSAKTKARKEVLEVELETVQMLRRRAKDDPQKAMAAAERELELEGEIKTLNAAEAA